MSMFSVFRGVARSLVGWLAVRSDAVRTARSIMENLEPRIQLSLNAPSNVSASFLSDGYVKITFTDMSVNENGFRVEYSTDGINFVALRPNGPLITDGSTNGSNVTEQLNNLQIKADGNYYDRLNDAQAQTYQIRVVAVDGNPNDDTPSTNVVTIYSGLAQSTQLTAAASEPPASPQITLSWTAPVDVDLSLGFNVYRTTDLSQGWPNDPTATVYSTSYLDTNVVSGTRYYYRVTCRRMDGIGGADHDTSFGYVTAGLDIAAITSRGTVDLIVAQDAKADNTVAPRIARFEQDLVGDGWNVIEHVVPRGILSEDNIAQYKAQVAQVKTLIQNDYYTPGVNLRQVVLLGHITVPYAWAPASPDGHPARALPSDEYYGDVNGTWNDTGIFDQAYPFVPDGPYAQRNQNAPDDGKFDGSDYAQNRAPELAIGRIDMANLGGSLPNEMTLLNQYLDRDHAWRQGIEVVASGAFSNDNWDGNSISGGPNTPIAGPFAALVGPNNTHGGDFYKNGGTNDKTDIFANVFQQGYLFASLWAPGFGLFGPGLPGEAVGINTSDSTQTVAPFSGSAMADTSFPYQAVFSAIWGSFVVDWDTTVEPSVLRAMLASPGGNGLIAAWNPAPAIFSAMGSGQTAGDCYLNSQLSSNPYAALQGAWFSLMGDPTLRVDAVKPSATVTVSDVGTYGNELTWTASPDSNVTKYVIYRASGDISNPTSLSFTKIGETSDGSTTTYTDTSFLPGGSYTYMIRAVKLQSAYSGSYYNQSQGTFATIVVPPTPINFTLAEDSTSTALAWSAPAGAFASYQVYRASIPSSDTNDLTTLSFTKITGTDLPSTANGYSDSAVLSPGAYIYVVAGLITGASPSYSGAFALETVGSSTGDTYTLQVNPETRSLELRNTTPTVPPILSGANDVQSMLMVGGAGIETLKIDYSGGNAACFSHIDIEAGSGDTSLWLLNVSGNGTISAAGMTFGISSITFANLRSVVVGGDSSDNAVMIDTSAGNPVPAGGLYIDGGGGDDTITIDGNNAGAASIVPADDSTLEQTFTWAGNAVDLTDVNHLRFTRVSSFTVTTANAQDTILLNSPSAGINEVIGTSIQFSNIQNFMFIAGGADDTLAIDGNNTTTINITLGDQSAADQPLTWNGQSVTIENVKHLKFLHTPSLQVKTPHSKDNIDVADPSTGVNEITGTSDSTHLFPIDMDYATKLYLDIATNDDGATGPLDVVRILPGVNGGIIDLVGFSNLKSLVFFDGNYQLGFATGSVYDVTGVVQSQNLSLGIDGGWVTVDGMVTVKQVVQTSGTLTINGSLSLAQSPDGTTATSILSALPTIGSGGQFDISNNDLIINYGTQPSPNLDVRNLLKNGRNGGAGQPGNWNGLGGIVSSYVKQNGNGFNLAIGYGDNEAIASVRGSGSYTSFGGQTVASTTILIRTTYGADLTLDGVVDSQDVTTFGHYFNDPGSGQWVFGDFDYSGTCDVTDVNTLGATLGKTSPALSVEFSLSGPAAIVNNWTWVAYSDALGVLNLNWDDVLAFYRYFYQQDSSSTVDWTEKTGEAYYRISYSTDSTFQTGVTQLTLPADVASTVLGGLADDTFYYVRVDAVCPFGSLASALGTLTAPDAPGIGSPDSDVDHIDLAWSSVNDAFYYNIYRSDGGSTYYLIGSTSDTAFTDDNVVANATYHYVVTAVNMGYWAESAYSNDLVVNASPPGI